jgi:kumamolisin
MPTCHHYHRIHPRLRGVRLGSRVSKASFPSGTLSPAEILIAYGFRQNEYADKVTTSIKIGVGSLGGGVVQADVDNSVAAWGMLAPKITVRTVGGATSDPASNTDANVENSLDLLPAIAFTYWFLTGRAADITICFGPNATNGMKLVTDDLVAAGCKVASWSWGSAEAGWDPSERDALAASFKAAADAGVTFCAASGDNSIDDGTSAPSADYPASDSCVWAVGGTNLQLAADGSRASESAWGDGLAGDEGGGGGFDPVWAMPPFQQGIVNPPAALGSCRGIPDSAANADPNSGWQMSANGSWTVVGGTSASSPFTAALIAVAKSLGGIPQSAGLLTPLLYALRTTAVNDITTGSNGDPAAPGWDPATGLGSPNGAGFISALASSNASAPTPPTLPTPPDPNPPAPPIPPPPPPATSPAVFNEFDAADWAAEGIVESWPDDNTTPTLSDLQAWASRGLAENFPSDDGQKKP